MSIILESDSYKNSHEPQYPPGTEYVHSYFESRAGAKFPYTVFYGLQIILEKLAKGVTKADVDEAESYFLAHMGSFNRAKWDYIVEEHGGKLPIEIRAVPEGLVVPTGN